MCVCARLCVCVCGCIALQFGLFATKTTTTLKQRTELNMQPLQQKYQSFRYEIVINKSNRFADLLTVARQRHSIVLFSSAAQWFGATLRLRNKMAMSITPKYDRSFKIYEMLTESGYNIEKSV